SAPEPSPHQTSSPTPNAGFCGSPGVPAAVATVAARLRPARRARTLHSAAPRTPNAELHGRIPRIGAKLSVRGRRGRATQRSGQKGSRNSALHTPPRGHAPAATLAVEASEFLVGSPVFKTGEAEYLGLAGSIPVRLRQMRRPARAQSPTRTRRCR